MLKLLSVRFMRDDAGATAIEYGLIAGLIAVALISSMIVFGGAVTNLFGSDGVGSAGSAIEQSANSIR
ncbi:Flp family type IVb pilin [Devosia rhizoryzae]|uniref:Flp family type IVb pilin n=1 Tax=Devosia rhizoryzae TaxID=2774137 RepID=A0ABX7C575_9HYPH|nr:Flp family type IVb pilin [Devosia rhizoryzae]QQR39394.1 Flp family type IVb pilin [Devosia rhizoryzae]